MFFKSLKLRDFRNYTEISLDFDEKLNVFTGKNAQGKTNLAEALYIMSLGKSFRTNNDKEMIRFGCEFSKAAAVVCDDGDEKSIEVIYSEKGKALKLNGVTLPKAADLLENVYVVVFSPDDLRIVKDGPENRRRFLDREICQVRPLYYSDLGNYKRILKQRNVLLKNRCSDYTLLEVFDESLASCGIRLINERLDFIKKLSVYSEKIHGNISGGSEKLSISYESPALGLTAGEYKKKLKENFERDMQRGFTSFGPHKDDLFLSVNGTDIRYFGSRGQQRTAALSLKLAELDFIREETGKNAVLILDDVLSELDSDRQRFLMDFSSDVQIFITAASLDGNLKVLQSRGKSFIIDNAKVEIYNC